MKEKWFMKKKHVVPFNLLAIGCAMFFTGCNKHLDDAIIEKIPSETNSSTATTTHVDCLHQRWYEGSELTKAEGVSAGIDFTDVLKFIAEKVTTGAFSKVGGFAADEIISIFIQDQTQTKLDEILDRLSDIQTSINTLSNTVKLANYDAALREKETMHINLQSRTVEAWLTLQALDKNTTLSSEERISRRKEVVRKWGDSNINAAGTTNYATKSYAAKIMSLAAEQKNYFQIYDEYASKYFGFESESFAWRENCRDRDITLLAIAFTLSNMYENLVNAPDDVSSLSQIILNMEKFITVYSVNYEIYNSGFNICYIPKLEGLKFKREILEIPYDWYTDYTNGVQKDIDRYSNFSGTRYLQNMPSYHDSKYYFLTAVMNFGNNADRKYKHLSQGQISLIHKFYNERSNNKLSLEEIFYSHSFKIVQTDYTGKNILKEGGTTGLHYRVLLSSNGHRIEEEAWYNYNYKLYMRGVEMMSKEGFHDDFRIGIAWNKDESKYNAVRLVEWDTKPYTDVRFYCLYYLE